MMARKSPEKQDEPVANAAEDPSADRPDYSDIIANVIRNHPKASPELVQEMLDEAGL